MKVGDENLAVQPDRSRRLTVTAADGPVTPAPRENGFSLRLRLDDLENASANHFSAALILLL